MKFGIRLTAVILGSVLFVPAAGAETWKRVFEDPSDGYYSEIDMDSIRKGDDGLVYYRVGDDIGVTTAAIDCANRIYYVIGNIPDWRSKGTPITDHSNAAEEKVVC